MRRGVLLGLLLATLGGLSALAVDANADDSPAARVAVRPPPRDVVVNGANGVGPELRARAAQWGGGIQASNGETVTIFFSDSYPQDPAFARSWADFMTSLVHGTELSSVTILLAPLTEVQRYCGGAALACYSPSSGRIVASATDPVPGTTAKGVLIHEYGHHVASSRRNTPFSAGDYGTKRWSSHMNICARAQKGQVFPGAEDADHYMLNPGEGFAESYRVLNEQRLGLPQEAWDIVSTALAPNARALALLLQDVAQPWTHNMTGTLRATLTASHPTRTVRFTTPLDGALFVTPRQTGRVKVGFRLQSSGGIAAARTFSGAAAPRVATSVCGERRFTARLTLVGGVARSARTSVSLTVSRP
jgi:hypothetical protein